MMTRCKIIEMMRTEIIMRIETGMIIITTTRILTIMITISITNQPPSLTTMTRFLPNFHLLDKANRNPDSIKIMNNVIPNLHLHTMSLPLVEVILPILTATITTTTMDSPPHEDSHLNNLRLH